MKCVIIDFPMEEFSKLEKIENFEFFYMNFIESVNDYSDNINNPQETKRNLIVCLYFQPPKYIEPYIRQFWSEAPRTFIERIIQFKENLELLIFLKYGIAEPSAIDRINEILKINNGSDDYHIVNNRNIGRNCKNKIETKLKLL